MKCWPETLFVHFKSQSKNYRSISKRAITRVRVKNAETTIKYREHFENRNSFWIPLHDNVLYFKKKTADRVVTIHRIAASSGSDATSHYDADLPANRSEELETDESSDCDASESYKDPCASFVVRSN